MRTSAVALLLAVLFSVSSAGAVRRVTARERLDIVRSPANPILWSLLNAMTRDNDNGYPPEFAAVGRQRTTLRVRWGGCGFGTVDTAFRPIIGLAAMLHEAGFRRLYCENPTWSDANEVWDLED